MNWGWRCPYWWVSTRSGSRDSLQFSRSVVSDSLWPHEPQHARPPCPSPTPGVYPNPCPWVGDAIKPSHPLLSPSLPALNLSQDQGLFKWISSLHLLSKVMFTKQIVCAIQTFRRHENKGTSSVKFSRSVVSNSLRPHGLQRPRLPCLSPTPETCSNSCPSSQWCHPAISSSVVPFSSCPQSFPASRSFQMSQLFTWGGQSIGVSASTSVLPMNIQDWSPLGWAGWISLQS